MSRQRPAARLRRYAAGEAWLATAVIVRVHAHESTGAVQTYQLSYLVSGGTIIAGQQTLVRTSR